MWEIDTQGLAAERESKKNRFLFKDVFFIIIES